MRVLVCGSRRLPPRGAALVLQALQRLKATVVIEGGARGADEFAMEAARALGIQRLTYGADWEKHGAKAGPMRNQVMLTEGKPDHVVAFHTDPKLGTGTADMVRRARKAGIPVEVVLL